MRSNIKHLGLGLSIGLFIAAFLISGLVYVSASVSAKPVIPLPPILLSSTSTSTPITPSPTKTQTPIPTTTRTSTPTSAPTSTRTPTPTATLPMIDQMIQDGRFVLSGPLSPDQQRRLYQSALEFIAPTTKQSKQVGVTINGVGYGSPSLICGPLSVAILQNAGLIDDPDVVPHDFWLLNPYIPQDRALLNRVFPWQKYENKLFEVPLNKFDWKNYPLEPGDFLFIKHGSWGNFDHMLVVTRVDNLGRRYSVTNFNTPDGFIINETMLYDPNDPTAGIFHTWTARANAVDGATGFGGFESWRLRRP